MGTQLLCHDSAASAESDPSRVNSTLRPTTSRRFVREPHNDTQSVCFHRRLAIMERESSNKVALSERLSAPSRSRRRWR